MICNNPNLDHVNINAHTNLVKFYKVLLKILSGNKIMTDGWMDGQNDRQPKSNITDKSHFFKAGLYNKHEGHEGPG